jgi:hypothetical protein
MMNRGIWLSLVVISVACKGGGSPAGTPTALGTSGLQIDVPAGWKVGSQREIAGQPRWDIEFGDQSSESWKVVWCGIRPMMSIDELYQLPEVCYRADKDVKKEVLASGAYAIECVQKAMGNELQHVSVAVKLDDTRLGHCWYQPTSPTADHRMIVNSLRIAAKSR